MASPSALRSDRDGWQTAGAGLVGRLDNQRHERRVLDAQVEAVPPASDGFEDAENGVHLGRLREFYLLLGVGGLCRLDLGGRLQRGKDDTGGLLNHFQALGQQ